MEAFGGNMAHTNHNESHKQNITNNLIDSKKIIKMCCAYT
jgi:hypothetical protein